MKARIMQSSLTNNCVKWGAIVAPVLAGAAFMGTPTAAQNVFPCGGGPNEQQIGVDTNGPVTVPLCVTRPSASGSSSSGSESEYRWTPPPLPKPPRGWRPVFGAWKSFETARIPGTDRFVFDYVISLGHATPGEALAAVRELCMAKPRVYDEQEGTCQGFPIDEPYVTVVQYPDVPALGNQRNTILVYDTRVPNIDGLTRLDSGEFVICSMPSTPRHECIRVRATMINGVIPRNKENRKQRKRQQ